MHSHPLPSALSQSQRVFVPGKAEGPGACPHPSSSSVLPTKLSPADHISGGKARHVSQSSPRLYVNLNFKKQKDDGAGLKLALQDAFCHSSWPRSLVSVFPGHCEAGRGRGRWAELPSPVQLFPLTSVHSHCIQHRLQFHIDLHQCLR